MALLIWFEVHQYDTTQVVITTWSKLDKMTVSSSLKKLVLLGYVHRMEHEIDTRAKSVSLTPKGKDLVRKLVPIIEEIDSVFFAKTSASEQKSLIRVLGKLASND